MENVGKRTPSDPMETGCRGKSPSDRRETVRERLSNISFKNEAFIISERYCRQCFKNEAFIISERYCLQSLFLFLNSMFSGY